MEKDPPQKHILTELQNAKRTSQKLPEGKSRVSTKDPESRIPSFFSTAAVEQDPQNSEGKSLPV